MERYGLTEKPQESVPEAPPFDLETSMAASVAAILKNMAKAALFHPKERRFMARYLPAAKAAADRRAAAASQGRHVPPFLIASITRQCNLHCTGCFAHALRRDAPGSQLSTAEWARVFQEARDLGIGFVFLAGGEPLVRRDVLEAAAGIPQLLFPVITNGTLLDDRYLDFFDRSRNLVPLLSLEGSRAQTDRRRGAGIYQTLQSVMTRLGRRGIAFGVSVTVTTENLQTVVSDAFVRELAGHGCKLILYVEFVPTDDSLRPLALGDDGSACLERRLAAIRQATSGMVILAFPGDEKHLGGCLAAGRGFFHINAGGGAEPCPFSPYSDTSVRDRPLRDVLDSALFRQLQTQDILTGSHTGGCVLYEKRQEVAALARRSG